MSAIFSNRISALQPSAIREILKAPNDPDLISFAAGNPSPETFPSGEMAEIAAEIFQKDYAAALQYGVTEGYMPLRERMARRLSEKYRLGGDDDELIITSGGQQAIELCAKVLLNEGDTVLCEEPSFIGALNALRSYNVRLRGVPSRPDGTGMDMDALEAALKETPGVKLIYTIPTFQNPTGSVMPEAARKRMLELCELYDTMILEDSPYFELRYDGEYIPPIKAFDKNGRVIYAGSFSKVIAPGIRMGLALGPKEVIQKMVVAKQVSDVHTNLFFQILCDRYMEREDFDGHIAACRELYRRRRDVMADALQERCAESLSWVLPQGGLFFWCLRRDGGSGAELCTAAKKRKVMAVPGSAFLVDDTALSPGIRFNFSLPDENQIREGIRRMAEAIEEVTG